MERMITDAMLAAFKDSLYEKEKSPITVKKYLRDIRAFRAYCNHCVFTKREVLQYKERLTVRYAVASANSMLAALNCFFRFCGWLELLVKQFKLQRKAFCPAERELTKEDYRRLVKTAEKGKRERISLVIQTICVTGIRVSELSFITVEAVKRGRATVSCKGKTREVFIIAALQKKLLRYIKKQGISSGTVFVTGGGKPLDRSNIWREMKALCREAGVLPEKVFPHNLRHLFARTFYGIEKDIAKLADILGHSNINTTRIYITTTGEEHRRRMEHMHLIL